MRIAAMPAPRRLAAALFACMILAFGLLAQVNLWTHVGGGGPPGPERVLWKYHGKPGASKLHKVLDLALPKEDPHAMWPYLGGATDAELAARAKDVLAWVDRGAPREAWDTFAPIFTGAETCGQCHAPGGLKANLPLDTYEHVLPVTAPDTGIAWGELTVTAHNHFFSFAVAALLLSLLLSFTGLAARLQVALVLAAFAGPALDVGCWFLTKWYGAPFHLGVMLGGALFGGAMALMAAVILWEATLGARRLAGG